MNRMLPTPLIDFLDVLSKAVEISEDGNGIVIKKPVHITQKLLLDDGIASNGTSDLGNLEGITLTPNDTYVAAINDMPSLYVFGTSCALAKGNATCAATPKGSVLFSSTSSVLRSLMLGQEKPFNHILCMVEGGSLFWLEAVVENSQVDFKPNIDIGVGQNIYFISAVLSVED